MRCAIVGTPPSITDVNLAVENHAHSLIAAGKFDRATACRSTRLTATRCSAAITSASIDSRTKRPKHATCIRSPKAVGALPFRPGSGEAACCAVARRRDREGGELTDVIDKPKSVAWRLERKAFAFQYRFVDKGAARGNFEGYASVFNRKMMAET